VLGDVQNLPFETRLNGRSVQRTSTSDMKWPIGKLVAYISQIVSLEPGDVIGAGTPTGVGHTRVPPRYLKAGDVLEVEIRGVGCLRNTCVAASSPHLATATNSGYVG